MQNASEYVVHAGKGKLIELKNGTKIMLHKSKGNDRTKGIWKKGTHEWKNPTSIMLCCNYPQQKCCIISN